MYLVWFQEPNYFGNCTKRATYISHVSTKQTELPDSNILANSWIYVQHLTFQLEEAGLETEEDEDMESKGIDLRYW